MKSHTILKAVLLYTTELSIFCFLAGGCEGLMDNNHPLILLFWTILNVFLVCLCIRCISYKELYKLSGAEALDTLYK